MTSAIQQIAEAFSGHRFAEVYPHLAADIRWVLPGQATLEGSDAVIAACENTTAGLTDATTEFTRFVCAAGSDVVAIDVIARYSTADGQTSVVSSCDIYEFTGDVITRITSYGVELTD